MRFKYSLKELLALPTIRQGQADDLKVETPYFRFWLSRMTKVDGMEYDNQVTIEEYKDDKWITIGQYEAK